MGRRTGGGRLGGALLHSCSLGSRERWTRGMDDLLLCCSLLGGGGGGMWGGRCPSLHYSSHYLALCLLLTA